MPDVIAKQMTIQEFAKKLDGREYSEEITPNEIKAAVELGFVVVYGYSDDNAEFAGAINDEVGCFDGEDIYLDKDGIFEECEDNCKYSVVAKSKCKVIKAIWHDGIDEYSWTYETDIPHATFEIVEDGEKYCRGIVFDINNLETGEVA